jgi:acyl-CoA thioesterase-1
MQLHHRRTTVEIFGFWLLWALVCTALPGRAEEARTPVTVLCLGDSLTEGYGLDAKQAYPAVLEARLHAEGYEHVRVINAGISGSTSASAVSRLKWQMRAQPDVLILELGANDGLRGVGVEDTRKNLRAAIAMAQERETLVLLAGMKMPPNYGPSYTREFEETFSLLGELPGVSLIPFFLEGVAGQPRLNLPDGIHPTAEGYGIVVDNLLPHLLPLL